MTMEVGYESLQRIFGIEDFQALVVSRKQVREMRLPLTTPPSVRRALSRGGCVNCSQAASDRIVRRKPGILGKLNIPRIVRADADCLITSLQLSPALRQRRRHERSEPEQHTAA